jgi:small-conductance mechanosensitive channel/CRP-like cAMP-binding protein
MAVPSGQMLDPPAGWLPGHFWHDLELEFALHRILLSTLLLFVMLILIGRHFVSERERRRLRTALLVLTFYPVSLPLRALLLSNEYLAGYFYARLGALILCAYGLIAVGVLLLYDALFTRLGVHKILRDVIIIGGFLITTAILLSRSGINLLSIIATSAVLTAVIGLALQDTLGNLLSGIALELEASISLGDWIRVDERAIGRVTEIRWRSTTIQTKAGDLITLPNAIVAKGVVTNFNKGVLQHRQWLRFNAHLRHPPDEVQRVVLECLRGLGNVSQSPPPDCIFESYEDSWARYGVRYRLVDYGPDDPTDSEVRKRIWYALHRAQIEISYPGHNVFVTQLDHARELSKEEHEQERRMAALGRVSFFAPLSDQERRQLVLAMHPLVFGQGETILRAGEAGDSLYLVRSGRVAVQAAAGGIQRTVARIGEGDFFGEMGLLTGEPRRATVVAESEAVECYVIDRGMFQQLLQKKPGLADEIGALLIERVKEMQGWQRELMDEAMRHHLDKSLSLVDRIKQFFGIT